MGRLWPRWINAAAHLMVIESFHSAQDYLQLVLEWPFPWDTHRCHQKGLRKDNHEKWSNGITPLVFPSWFVPTLEHTWKRPLGRENKFQTPSIICIVRHDLSVQGFLWPRGKCYQDGSEVNMGLLQNSFIWEWGESEITGSNIRYERDKTTTVLLREQFLSWRHG